MKCKSNSVILHSRHIDQVIPGWLACSLIGDNHGGVIEEGKIKLREGWLDAAEFEEEQSDDHEVNDGGKSKKQSGKKAGRTSGWKQ